MFLFVSLFGGIKKVFRYWQIVLLFVVIQLVFVGFMANPLVAIIHQEWDHSLIGGQLQAKEGLELIVWNSLFASHSDVLNSIYNTSRMVMAGLVYIVFSMFFLAGALMLYSGMDLKFSWQRFWVDASKYFRSFLGLALIAMIFFVAADMASVFVDDMMADAIAESDDEMSRFITGVLITGGFRFLLFSLLILVFQYAKVIAAAEHLRNILYLTRKAFVFVVHNFFKIIILFLILGLLELGINALDTSIWFFFINDSAQWIQVSWIVLVSIMLVVIKLSFFSCQLFMFDETKRRADETGAVRVGLDDYY